MIGPNFLRDCERRAMRHATEDLPADIKLPEDWMKFGSLEYTAVDKLHYAWKRIGMRWFHLEYDAAVRNGCVTAEDASDAAFSACYPLVLELEMRTDLDEAVGYGLSSAVRYTCYEKMRRRPIDAE